VDRRICHRPRNSRHYLADVQAVRNREMIWRLVLKLA
jgi:hypothetical protein